jgi:hypothetical protein
VNDGIEYAPPEVLFGEVPYHLLDPQTYDIWSAGVLVNHLSSLLFLTPPPPLLPF